MVLVLDFVDDANANKQYAKGYTHFIASEYSQSFEIFSQLVEQYLNTNLSTFIMQEVLELKKYEFASPLLIEF